MLTCKNIFIGFVVLQRKIFYAAPPNMDTTLSDLHVRNIKHIFHVDISIGVKIGKTRTVTFLSSKNSAHT